MYVDSHQHFWKLSRGDYSWMTPDMKVLYKDFFPEDLEPLIKDKNITQTVIVQAADTVAETEFTLSLASKHDFIAGVVGWVDLDNDKAKDDIDKLCESNFLKGFRPMIHDIQDDEWMLKENLSENLKYMNKKNLTFDALVRPNHLKHLIKFVNKYDFLPVVIDHIAKPVIINSEIDEWKKDITALSPVSWYRLGEDAYFNGNDFIVPNQITGAPNGTSNGMPATALVADAPGSYAAGLGSSLVETDRLGDAPLSTANSLSFNMTPENRISYPAGYTPTQVDNVYSMAFDGANDHILTGLAPASYTSFSISAWVYANSLGSYNGVASQYRAGTPASSAWFLETIGGNMAFGVANGGTLQYATKAFSTSAWHHVVGVWDGSQVEVYIDGVASGSPQSITAMNTATVNMAIGGIWNNGGTLVDNGMWNGKIDEVAIFDYALTPRQIKQDIYNGTTSGKTADLNNISNLTAPIAWYRMGD